MKEPYQLYEDGIKDENGEGLQFIGYGLAVKSAICCKNAMNEAYQKGWSEGYADALRIETEKQKENKK